MYRWRQRMPLKPRKSPYTPEGNPKKFRQTHKRPPVNVPLQYRDNRKHQTPALSIINVTTKLPPRLVSKTFAESVGSVIMLKSHVIKIKGKLL